MAFGNLLGSNLFDVVILAFDDFAFLRGPLYAHLLPLHGVTPLTACAMSGAVIVALVCRPVARGGRTAKGASLVLLVLNAAVRCLQSR